MHPAVAGVWPSVSTSRHINCGLPPEFFFAAPAATINFDPHSFNTPNAIGVIPLLTATPCTPQQNVNAPTSINENLAKKPLINLDHSHLFQSGVGGYGGSSSSSMGATTCQDCGNQAKKDCSHTRCRTCCKSRGYDCVTHVKSTWVSAVRRRERQCTRDNTAAAGSSQSTSASKKPRLGGTSQTTTASHTSTSSSSHQDASFKESLPGQVRAPAVFKCVRVTALDDGEDEYAYQAVVKIGGRVFKGFLYDQGIAERDEIPSISELHLGGSAHVSNSSSRTPVVDPTSIFTGSGLLGGTSYGNQLN